MSLQEVEEKFRQGLLEEEKYNRLKLADAIQRKARKEIYDNIQEQIVREERANHPLRQIAEDPLWAVPKAFGWLAGYLFSPFNAAKEYAHSLNLDDVPTDEEKRLYERVALTKPELLSDYQRHLMTQPTIKERVLNAIAGKRYAATYIDLLNDIDANPYIAGILGATGEVLEGYLFSPRFINATTTVGELSKALTEEGKVISLSKQAQRLKALKELAGKAEVYSAAAETAQKAKQYDVAAQMSKYALIAKQAQAKVSIAEKLFKTRKAYEAAGKILQPFGGTLIEQGIRGQIAPVALDIGGIRLSLKSPSFYKALKWFSDKLGLSEKNISTLSDAQRMSRGLITTFKRTTFYPKLDKLLNDYVNLKTFRMKEFEPLISELCSYRDEIAAQIRRYFRAEGITKEEAIDAANNLLIDLGETKIRQRTLFEPVERENIIKSYLRDFSDALSPEFRKQINDAAELQKRISKMALRQQQESKMNIRALPGNLDYLAHIITPEAREIYNNPMMAANARKIYSDWHAGMKRRVASADIMITEWNKAVREGMLGDAFKGVKFFYDDPVVLAHITASRAANKSAVADLLNTILKYEKKGGFCYAKVPLSDKEKIRSISLAKPDYTFYLPKNRRFHGLRIEDVLASFQELFDENELLELTPELLEELSGKLKSHLRRVWAYCLPKPVAAELKKTLGWSENFANQNALWRAYDRSLEWLRAQALVSPAWHARNFLGGNIPNFLIEGGNPKNLIKAAIVQSGRPAVVISPTGEIYDTARILELAERHGVRHTGFIAQEAAIPKTIREIYSTSKNPFARNFILFKYNQRIGEIVEDHSRLALFIDGLEKGLDPVRAAARVDSALFTYHPEKLPESMKWLRRALFFPRWYMANLWFHMNKLVEKPAIYKSYQNIVMGLGRTLSPVSSIDYVPDFILEAGGIPVSYDKETGRRSYFLLGGYFAPSELRKLERPLDTVLEQLSPPLKTLVEFAIKPDSGLGYSFYYNRPIQMPGERDRWMGIEMPKSATYLLRNIRILNDIDRAFFRKGDYVVSPLGRAIRQILGLSLLPVPERKTKLAKKRKKEKEKWVEKRMKVFFRKREQK